MSTDVDGAQPSTRPGSDSAEAAVGPVPPADPPRDVPVPTARAPSSPLPPSPSGAAGDAAPSDAAQSDPAQSDAAQGDVAQSDVEPDTDAVDLHRELRRRAAVGSGGQARGGRHARQDGNDKSPPRDYVPRHAMSTPGPGTLPPAGSARLAPYPAPEPGPAIEHPAFEPANPESSGPPPKRVRVVLAERKRPIHPVGPDVHMRELDDVGEVLSANLIKSQLGLALRFAAIAAIVLGLLPVMFAAFPALGRVEILGIRLPWLALGILSYPLLVALGWLYTRATERLELSFTEHLK